MVNQNDIHHLNPHYHAHLGEEDTNMKQLLLLVVEAASIHPDEQQRFAKRPLQPPRQQRLDHDTVWKLRRESFQRQRQLESSVGCGSVVSSLLQQQKEHEKAILSSIEKDWDIADGHHQQQQQDGQEEDMSSLGSDTDAPLVVASISEDEQQVTAVTTNPTNNKKTAVTPTKPSVVSRRKTNNSNNQSKKVVLVGDVGPNDVILGRCKKSFNNLGNKRFRNFINLYLDQYQQKATCPKKEKTELIKSIVLNLKEEMGVRLLKPIKASSSSLVAVAEYVELGEKEMCEKVGHALRDACVKRQQVTMTEFIKIAKQK